MQRTNLPLGVSDIFQAARYLAQLAEQYQEPFSAVVNNTVMVAGPGDSSEVVVQSWQSESDREADMYLSSPKYRREQAKAAKRFRRRQIKLDQLMRGLQSLDFTNYGAVIDWLDQLTELSNLGASARSQIIVAMFGRNDFQANVNMGDNFRESDAENYARYLIGQALAFLGRVTTFIQVSNRRSRLGAEVHLCLVDTGELRLRRSSFILM